MRVECAMFAMMAAALLLHGAHATNRSAAQEAVDLSAMAELGEDSAQLESLLHWAIGHSDPEKLREAAETARRDGAQADQLARKRARVAELAHIVSQQPTEAELMMDDISLLQQPDAPHEAKLAALQQLQGLVEPIDNANDLRVLGGLAPLLQMLGEDSHPELKAAAAHTLGTASSNNGALVAQLLADAPHTPQLLLRVAYSSHQDAATKAMYALGCIIRAASGPARGAFYHAGGLEQLLELLTAAPAMGGTGAGATRVRVKAATLLADLADEAAVSDADTGGADAPRDDVSLLVRFAATALDSLGQAGEDGKPALAAMQALLAQHEGKQGGQGQEGKKPSLGQAECAASAGSEACSAADAVKDVPAQHKSDGGGGGVILALA